jgi:hypothetical protein
LSQGRFDARQQRRLPERSSGDDRLDMLQTQHLSAEIERVRKKGTPA